MRILWILLALRGNGASVLSNLHSKLNDRNLVSEGDDDDLICRTVPDLPPLDQDTDRLSLWELMDKSKEKLLLSPDHRDVVLLLGNTGSGKTTITQLVAGNASALEVVQTEAGDVIIIDPAEKIGRTQASQTLIPELVVDPGTNLAIYDCPGFSDNRGPTVDITVNFLLKRVTDYIQSVKLIFTVIFSSVDGFNDKTDFDRLVTSAVRMITSFDKMKDGIGLVVTKAPLFDARGKALTDDHVLNKITTFLAGYKSLQAGRLNDLRPSEDRNIMMKKIAFVDVITQPGHIGVARVPQNCGFMDKSPQTAGMQKDLLNLFDKLRYVRTTEGAFGHSLTDSSLLEIGQRTDQISLNITNLSKKVVSQLSSALQERVVFDGGDFNEFSKTLEKEYLSLRDVLRNLSGSGSPKNVVNPKDMADKIQKFIVSCNYDRTPGILYKRGMEKLADYLNFFNEMKPDAEIDGRSWVEPFKDFLENVLGNRVVWAEFLIKLRTQLSSYDFHTRKPADIQAPEYPDLQFLDTLPLPSNFIDESVRNSFAKSSMADRALLKIILEEVLLPVSTECNGNSMFLKGNFIKTSDFVDEDGKYTACPGANILKIFVSGKFFMDRKISPNNTEGDEVVIYSPIWEVTTAGEVRIELQGVDAKALPVGKADKGLPTTEDGQSGTPGENGIPGNPGKPGGIFFGLGSEFINGERLLISANGGGGGRGQEGGDGSDGKQGRETTYDDFPSCWGLFTDSADFHEYFDKTEPGGSIFETWVTKYGGKGGQGGNGGSGGAGGWGGNPGIVNVISIGSCSKVPVVETKNGTQGSGGSGGKGGVGGKRGIGASALVWTSGLTGCGYNSINNNVDIGRSSYGGSDGSAGVNTAGRKDPEVQNPQILHWKSLVDYKTFLVFDQNVVLRNSFIGTMETNDTLLGLSFPTSFAYELLSLEKRALEIQEQKEVKAYEPVLLQRYNSLMGRIEEYAKAEPSISPEAQKVLSTLYATALARKNSYTERTQATLVVNLEGYLETVLNRFNDLKKVTTNVVIDKEREDFGKTFQDKVLQALKFIEEKVSPGIDLAEAEIQKTANELLQQIAKTEAETVNKEEEAKIQYQKAKSMMGLRGVFSALKIGASAVSFMGPQGAAIGGIIGTASSMAESFALPQDIKLRPQVPLPPSIRRYADKLEAQLKERSDTEIENLNVLIDYAKKAAKDNDDLKDVLKDVEDLEKAKQDLKDNWQNLSFSEQIKKRKSLLDQEKGIKIKMQAKLETYEKAFKDTSTSEARKTQLKQRMKGIKIMTSAVQTATELGYEIYNAYKNDEAKLSQLSDIVSQAGEELKEIRQYRDSVHTELLPLIEGIADDVQDAQRKMEGSSAVSLQVQKWEVKGVLTEFKNKLQDFTEGFEAQKKFGRSVDKLSEAITLMVDLYEYIDKYAEQTKLADYIATINSPDALKISIGDAEIAGYIARTEMALQSNVLLGEYDRAIQTFKQWIFPFGNSYTEDFKLSPDLPAFLNPLEDAKTAEEISFFLIPKLEEKVKGMQQRFKDFRDRYFPNVDVNLIDANFNSDEVSTDPFFSWGVEAGDVVKDLLSGVEVFLFPDPTYSYERGKSAVKFSVAEIQPKVNDPQLQAELDQVLKHFKVEMTHSGVSHYLLDGKALTMVGESVTLKYNFERNSETNEREGQNKAYEKFKNGTLTLSPYTTWTVKIKQVRNLDTTGFADLLKFAPLVQIELVGRGSYLDEQGLTSLQRNAFTSYGRKVQGVQIWKGSL